jgi:hypothetical protein
VGHPATPSGLEGADATPRTDADRARAAASPAAEGSSEFASTVFQTPPEPLDSVPLTENDLVVEATATEVAALPTLSQVGRYLLKRQLGRGGLGTVYEAWDPLLSRMVAVKTLQFDTDTPTRVSLDRLFLNEARAVAGLSHPYIVTVYDAGLSAHGVYIAMARLRGRDLRQALSAGWRPTPPQAAVLIRRVADALSYAHARGVVHCDIKPANIFLTRKDKPTVLDFGIARVAHRAGSGVPAMDGLIAGSPHYLAPEQLTGGVIDGRTDVYALGVVLFELLTGRKAFDGESLEQITEAVLHGPTPQAHELDPEVPQRLSALVAQAMARDPAERPAGALELSQALRAWHASQPTPATDGGKAAGPRSRGKSALVAGVAAVGLIGLGGWLALRPGTTTPPVQQAAAPAPLTAADPALLAVAMPPAAGDAASGALAATEPDTANEAAGTPAGAAVAAGRDDPSPPPAAKPPRPRPAKRVVTASKPSQAEGAEGSTVAKPAAGLGKGTVRLAISPWGQVEVNGKPAGVTPPLSRLELGEGMHIITIRNGDFPPYTTEVEVKADRSVSIRYRFGS